MPVLGKEAGDLLHRHVGNVYLLAQLEVGEVGDAVPRGDLDRGVVVREREVENMGQTTVRADGHSHWCLIDFRDHAADGDTATGLKVFDRAHHFVVGGLGPFN